MMAQIQLMNELEVLFQGQWIQVKTSQLKKIWMQAERILTASECYALLYGYHIEPDVSQDLMVMRLQSVKRQLIAFGVRPSRIKVLSMNQVLSEQPFYNAKIVTGLIRPLGV